MHSSTLKYILAEKYTNYKKLKVLIYCTQSSLHDDVSFLLLQAILLFHLVSPVVSVAGKLT